MAVYAGKSRNELKCKIENIADVIYIDTILVLLRVELEGDMLVESMQILE